MQKNNSQILDHFQKLLMEINFLRPEEDVFGDNGYESDPFIQKHLRQVKLKIAKYKAQKNKGVFQAVQEEIKRIKEIGAEEISKLINPDQQLQLQTLFRKFEEQSKNDSISLENDVELLQIISAIKDKLDQEEKLDDND